MRVIDWLKKSRDNYVEKTNSAVIIPNDFEDENQEVIRKHFLFSGRVQQVGFRVEMCLMAERLGLTGWAKNLTDGCVEAEVQGTSNRIDFLVKYLKSVKRIHINKYEEEKIPIEFEEKDFSPYYN